MIILTWPLIGHQGISYATGSKNNSIKQNTICKDTSRILRLHVCHQVRQCAYEVQKVRRQAKAFGLEIMKLELINDDCMNVMRDYPDNYFDLAIVDPPYGIDAGNLFGGEARKSGQGASYKTAFKKKSWDKKIPTQKYFNHLFRVSKNQIIWGANYMSNFLFPSMGWIVWDKNNGTTKFSDSELAFSSFNKALRNYKYTWNGMLQGDMKNKEHRIHPTQKPVKLYEWLYDNYAEKGQKILDTHLGSGSNAIAAHYAQMGEFVGIELDPDYFNAAKARIEQETKQVDMFSGAG